MTSLRDQVPTQMGPENSCLVQYNCRREHNQDVSVTISSEWVVDRMKRSIARKQGNHDTFHRSQQPTIKLLVILNQYLNQVSSK